MDEVCDSPKRPIGKITPTLNRVYVLPLEGKGDRSAVDEVKMRTRSPSRSVNSSLLPVFKPKCHKFPKSLYFIMI